MYDKLRKNYPDAPKPLEADEMGLEFSDNALLKQGYSSIMVDSVREILYERLFEDENSDDKKVCLNKRECDIEGLISSEDHYKDY